MLSKMYKYKKKDERRHLYQSTLQQSTTSAISDTERSKLRRLAFLARCRLLWSTVILYATLLSYSLASTGRATPGHC